MKNANLKNTTFLNSEYIVIEYIDLIKSPYLILLNVLRQNPKLQNILKIEEINYLNSASLYEWYVYRNHQNFFIDLNRYPDEISNEDLNNLLESQISITPRFYYYAVPLILTDFLKVLSRKKLVNHEVIIYHPHKNDYAIKDTERMTNHKFKFMDNFEEILDLVGSNSTFFLSDINKLLIMKKKGVLKFSSITLPIEYRYNKKNMKEWKLDIKELIRTDPFKLTYFQACSLTTNDSIMLDKVINRNE